MHAGRVALPFEGTCSPIADGWLVRLSVREEHVRISKDVVVYERATVRRGRIDEIARL